MQAEFEIFFALVFKGLNWYCGFLFLKGEFIFFFKRKINSNKALFCIKFLTVLLIFNLSTDVLYGRSNFSPPPPPSNDNCANAINVVVNGPTASGITQGATLEAGELNDCAPAGSTQSVWYYFTASANNISISLTSTSGACYFSSAIWPASSGCPASAGCNSISCQSAAGGPNITEHSLTNLIVGNNYYIQILYAPGGGCGNSAGFDIVASTTIPASPSNPNPISTCTNPSGPICVLNFSPSTYAQIASNCTLYNNPVSANNANEVYQACFSFTAQNSTNIDFQIANTSTCNTFNWLNWEIFNSSCNSFDCGSFPDMSSNGLICGSNYELCISFEIPSGCNYTSIIPYISAVPPVLSATAASGSSLVICNGSSTILTANATGYTNYQWAPSTGLNNTTGSVVTASPTSTTTYTVTGFDAGGCSQSTTVTVIVRPVPNINLTASNASCGNPNGFVLNTTNGGGSPYTFVWSNGQSIEDLSGLLAGTYTVTATNSFGCTSTASATVNSAGIFTASFVQINNNCFNGANGSINVTPQLPAVNGPYSYIWSTGATTQDLNNLTTGTYTITISNSVACTNILTALITSPPQLVLALSTTNVFCFGGATGSFDLTVSGGTPGYTYLWSNGATTQDISNLLAGNYSVTVHDINGCSATSIANNISQPVPINFASTVTNASCGGLNNGAVDITISGGNSPYSFFWSNGATTEDVSGLSAGAISINIFDANGCPYAWNTVITAGNSPTLSSIVTNASCFGLSNGGVNISVSNGTAPFLYNWSNGSTTQDLVNISANSYIVTVTDVNGCSVTGNYVVNSPSVIQLSETHTNSGCNNNFGTINLSVIGGTSSYIYNWNNSVTNQDLNGLSAGTFSVTVSDANNCTQTLSVVITQPPVNVVTLESTNPSCGINNGIAEIDQLTGGGGPFAYLWNTGGTDNEIDFLIAGTYSITVTNSFGCTSSASIILISPNGPTLSFTHTDVACSSLSNGSINMTVIGGTAPFTYLWSNGSTTEDISSLSAGTYNITVTDVNNCQAIGSVVISQNAGMVISQTNNNSTCGLANGNVDLTVIGNGPFTYLWNNASTNQDLPFVGAGSYSVTVTDVNSCTSSLSLVLNNTAGPTLVFIPIDASCNGSSTGSITLVVNGGVGPFSYNWDNGSTTQNLNNIPAGIYIVDVTDANNCHATGGIIINEPAPIIISSTNINAICGLLNASIDLTVSGGFSPYAYMWSNSAVTQDISGIGVGLYTVTVSDFQGCTNTYSVNISNSSGPILSETHINVSCFGAGNGSINLTVTGGVSPYLYFWNNSSTTQDQTNLIAGNYSVTVTDNNNCQSNISVTISEPGTLLINELHVDASCSVGNGSIDLSVSGGTGGYSYLWNNGTTLEDLTSLFSGLYTITVSDANICTGSLSINIGNSAGVSLSETHFNALCNGSSSGSIDLSVSGASPPFAYNWNNAATTQDINLLAAGVYTVTVSDLNNCESTLSIIISEPAVLNLSESNSDVLCNGSNSGAIDVSVSGGTSPYFYLWSNSFTTQDLSSLTTGNYSVTVNDINSCSASLVVNISEPSLLTVAESHVNSNCGNLNGSIDLTVGGGISPYLFLWNNSATTEDLSLINPGNYSVTVTDANNCTIDSIINLLNISGPTLTETHSDVLCFGNNSGSIDLSISAGSSPYNYLWSNGATTEDISNLVSGTYTVTANDLNNCQVILSVAILEQLAISISENHSDANCGISNGNIDLSISGGTMPYSYLWNNSMTTEDLMNIAAGIYFITVTDANNCTNAILVNIINLSGPVLSETHNNVLCNGGNNGSIDLSVSGGASPFSYVWSNAQLSQDINLLTSGNYSVTVSDLNNCIASLVVSISEPGILILNETHIDESCSNSNGSINLLIFGGVSPYQYLWSNNGTAEDISGLNAGVYTVTVNDVSGCTSSLNAIIANISSPTLSESHIDVLCNGNNSGAIDITVSSGVQPYTYIWNNGSINDDLLNLFVGNYIVTVSDLNNCQSTLSINILEPTSIVLSETHVDASCGATNGSIDLTVSGGVSGYSYIWNNAAISQDLINIAAGLYTVTVFDANNCSLANSITILNGNGPNLTETHINASCGNSNGSVNLTVSGGAAPYIYLWSNNSITQDISNLNGGIYIVTTTDNNGCSSSISISIQSGNAISLQSTITDVSCFGFNDGAVNLSVNSGASPFSFHWSNNSTTEDLSGLNGNNYDVTVTDINGCTSGLTVNVVEHAPLISSQTHNNETCGQVNGSISLTVIGGYQPYSYLWNTSSIAQNLTGIPAGNYSVTVSDINGCTSDLNIVVTGTSGPSLQLITTNNSCFGYTNGAIDLIVVGGTMPYSYLWNTNSVSQDLNSLSAGTYNVTVTDANNCTTDTSVIISEPAFILLSETHVDVTCGNINGAIDLTVNGGVSPYNYSWSNLSVTQDLNSVGIGQYDVSVSDLNNCTVTTSVNIINGGGTLPLSFNSTDEICSNSNGSIDLTVTSGVIPYSFSWSNGAITEDISSIIAGVYNVTVTDAGGCTGLISTQINNHPSAQLSETHVNETCGNANGSIDLSSVGGTLPLTFLWSNNAVTEDLLGLNAGNYSVTVSDSNNCTSNFSIQILNNASPLITEIHIDENCNQINGSIDLTINNGLQPYNYIWNNSLTTQDLVNLSAGNYSVTITDSNGCSSSQTVLINNIPPAQLSETHLGTTCGFSNGSIDLTVNGGAQPFIYTWSNNSVTQDLQNIVPSIYDITVIDAGGCVSLLSGIAISGSTSPQLSETHTASTCGNPNAGIDIAVSNGVTPYNFIWSNNSFSEDLTNVLSGNYTVTVSDNLGCTSYLSISVSDISGPQILLVPSATTCGSTDGSINLSINGGTSNFNYVWNNGDTTEDVAGLSGGNYSVTVIDANGCEAYASTAVIASTYPSIDAVISGNNGCIPLNVQFTNNSINSTTYYWIFGDGATSTSYSPLHQYNQIGSFPVTLIETSVTGCTDTMLIDTVTIYETPIADFTSVPWINESTLLSLANFQFTNQSVFASTYLWNFGDGNNSTEQDPFYIYTTEGDFYVTLFAFNDNGCADTVTYGPYVLLADGDIFIPNSFTPNNDNVNDVFKVYGTGINSVHMWIYDRWGELLYDDYSFSPEWKGLYHDITLNVGVYVYEVSVTRYDGTLIWKKGDVTLLK